MKNDMISLKFSKSAPCRLGDCPVGLFLHRDSLCFKNRSGLDVLVENGCIFTGGVVKSEDRDNLMVTPLVITRQDNSCTAVDAQVILNAYDRGVEAGRSQAQGMIYSVVRETMKVYQELGSKIDDE